MMAGNGGVFTHPAVFFCRSEYGGRGAGKG